MLTNNVLLAEQSHHQPTAQSMNVYSLKNTINCNLLHSNKLARDSQLFVLNIRSFLFPLSSIKTTAAAGVSVEQKVIRTLVLAETLRKTFKSRLLAAIAPARKDEKGRQLREGE